MAISMENELFKLPKGYRLPERRKHESKLNYFVRVYHYCSWHGVPLYLKVANDKTIKLC